MDPLSVTASTIGIIGAAVATYETIDKIVNLPKTFDEIKRDLPLVQSILLDAQESLDGLDLSDEQTQNILTILKPCNEAANELNRIFEAVQIQCEKDQGEKDWRRLRVVYHGALRGRKAHRVETLMHTIMNSLKKLALSRVFKTPMQNDVKAIETALNKLSKVEPSLEDAEFDHPAPINASQAVAEGASAYQNNSHGHNNTFNSGKYVTSGSGHTFNFGSQGDNNIFSRRSAILQKLKTSPYKDRKDRNPERTQGTCEWFMHHKVFQEWHQSKSSMLWVSADPGCGKSVLAKHLVDSILPTTLSRTTCYFFFKDDFEDQRRVESALCCILHQLFAHNDFLLSKKILQQFEGDENLTSSFAELWDILIHVAGDENAGEIVCIFDAFDECDDQGRRWLGDQLCKLYRNETSLKLKVLLTSRPYAVIRRGFQPLLPYIHLSGESDVEAENISREIDIFIEDRVRNIGESLRLRQDDQDLLLKRLMQIPNRTYLWVHLTLNLIEQDIDIDKAGIVHATTTIPQDVDNAYEKILSRSHDHEKAKKLLHIVVAAKRPLTLKEMDLALTIRENHRSYDDLDLKTEERFRGIVRDLCGLFVTVVDKKIYLLHQTAKEFLVSNTRMTPTKSVLGNLRWKHALKPQESHGILAEICMWHLLLSEFETDPVRQGEDLSKYAENHVFLDYSAKNWARHLRDSKIHVDSIMESVLRICDVSSKRSLTWFSIYWTRKDIDFPSGFTSLMLASYFGIAAAVRYLLQMDESALNRGDDTYSRSALSWAAENGFEPVVDLLIKHGRSTLTEWMFRKTAKLDWEDIYRRTPLSYAAANGHVAVVKLLLATRKVDVNARDEMNGTPLSYAICCGHEEVVKLLSTETDVESADTISRELLLSSAEKGNKAVVKMLLDMGKVDVDVKDENGWTPLTQAAFWGHLDVVKMLVSTGKVDLEAKDENGRTPLARAASMGRMDVVKFLVRTGKVDLEAKDEYGWTPLTQAAFWGHMDVVKLLVSTGKVDLEAKDEYGRTPLIRAASMGCVDVVKLLISTGKVDLEAKDQDGRTPLAHAASMGCLDVVKLLASTGKVDVDAKDENGRTPLARAASMGRVDVVKFLVSTFKVDVESRNKHRETPLSLATEYGGPRVVKELLKGHK